MSDKLPILLMMDTSTLVSSVSISEGKTVIGYTETDITNAHSEKLSVLIEEVVSKSGYTYKDIDAIGISKGPGSYTGLRIGVSTAKGLAYGLDIPLIAVSSLSIISAAGREKYPNYNTIPMIDAKRMEVYSAIYDKHGNKIKPISADLIEEGIYNEYIVEGEKYLIVGDGAEKTKEVFANREVFTYDSKVKISSQFMSGMTYDKYLAEDFEDTAYFEPYYLKDFIPMPSRVKGLYD